MTEARKVTWRALTMFGLILVAFLVVGYRYWFLQIKQAAHYQAMARQDTLRKLPVPAPRGNIVTSDGVVVATSKPSWTLYYLPISQQPTMPSSEVKTLAGYLKVSDKQLAQQVSKQESRSYSYQPVAIVSGLTAEQMTTVEENRANLPNIRLQPVAVRSYPYNSVMGNILGFTSPISAAQLKQPQFKGYSPTSVVGSAGLEYEYQSYLRGHSGGQFAEVNRQGQLVRLLGQTVPTPGDTLHLTINWKLEQTATSALVYTMKAMRHATAPLAHSAGAIQGAVVALDPNNGNVLAMASYPSYNPNKLLPNSTTRSSYYSQLANNPMSPFNVLPVSGLFAPGSVFKPLMAVAALATGTVTPSTQIYDPGYFPKDHAFTNWYAPGFGLINIEQALGLSDDVFFYTLGYDMGIQTMDKWMNKFLLNKPTGIDLPGEATSLIPSPALLMKESHIPWTWGWNLNTVIGQGIGQYSLIALARADAAIANGGTLYQPHLVSSITTATGKLVKKFSPVVQGKINVPYSVWHTVHVGMEMSAQDPSIAKGISGTGYGALAGLPVPVASKTGTSQVITQNSYNAYFLTYGPMPHPKILILVYIREGNWGADSGFVARAIYDQYFKIKDPKAQAVFDRAYGLNWKWPFGYTPPAAVHP